MSPSPRPLRAGFLPALLVACGLGLGGCDLTFPEQEIHLRYDPEADTLEMLLVYRGLTTPAGDARSLEKGVAALERLSAGAREFMLIEWPLYFEIDEWVERATSTLAAEEIPEADRSIARHFLDVAGNIELVSSGLFLDDQGRLSGYQWFRVRNVQQVQARVNAMISQAVLGQLGTDPSTKELGSRMAEALNRRARAGEPWFRLDSEGLTIDFPMPLEVSREGRRELLHELTETGPDEVFTDLAASAFAALSELAFEDERILARFGPQRGGGGEPLWFHGQVENPRVTYSEAFARTWRERQPESVGELTIDGVRELLE